MKILLLGSGALKIGEAGEFDYSGSQAIKVFKKNGHEVVLINPNIATVQTDPVNFISETISGEAEKLKDRADLHTADKVYFLPVDTTFVTRVIEKEKPDALALSFGGQTALNCGLELESNGTLKKHGVRVLGTPVEVIRHTEDREIFANKCREVGVLTPRSIPARTLDQAWSAAKEIGFPLIMRAGFALGGKGSGFCENAEKFESMVKDAFAFSPQVQIEEDLRGWKEIEYEVVRDQDDNAITVVNMENFDPLGIHTGESIVISPSMTLANTEYQMLRDVAIQMTRHLGIVGECNIQYALDPNDSTAYRVIEMNPRLSRSSALASKATGYPLAAVAAEILCDKKLPEIPNAITRVTTAFFEPALDYVALKIPRWDLQKFRKVSHEIATEMKSVGEVMALGRTFPEVIQKAIRMLNIGSDGILDAPVEFRDKDSIRASLELASPQRIFAIAQALYKNYFSVEEIWELNRIDRWFLEQIKRVTDAAQKLDLLAGDIDADFLFELKSLGFSDAQIAYHRGVSEMEIRAQRKKAGLHPFVKQVDTLAAEFPAQTNYLYTTYHGKSSDV
jgi:carbamoyl-phosphate synthase large subunit